MESSTKIGKMLHHFISVPNYQRAYAWDKNKHVETFFNDLIEHLESETTEPYYFGHFLFEKTTEEDSFYIIDGQQRVTTIVIFLSVLFAFLRKNNMMTTKEQEIFEDCIIRNERIKFSTVDYDNGFFSDYIIKQNKNFSKDTQCDTNSAYKIIDAFQFFQDKISALQEKEVKSLIDCIVNSVCTTHQVENQTRAVQMFIFQNDRGKPPTNLEILKSKFMYAIHLNGSENIEAKLKDISIRFGNIYKNISHINVNLKEDDILQYAYRYYKNSLNEYFDMKDIDKKIQKQENLSFIEEFTLILEKTFEHIKRFCTDEDKLQEVHSLITLGGIGIAYPFIVKTYEFGCSDGEKKQLFSSLEKIILRKRLIGDRAVLESRLNDVYKKFKSSKGIQKIVEHIEWLKNPGKGYGWWAYWNNKALEESIGGWVHHKTAVFILWKYENYIRFIGNKQAGYTNFLKYSDIEKPELEHIAPQNPSNAPETIGYCKYDDTFINEGWLHCFGNYLLLTKSHNCSVSNGPFADKAKTYTHLKQQEEVKKVFDSGNNWDIKAIDERHNKITQFILDNF